MARIPWATGKKSRKAWIVPRDYAEFAGRLRATIIDRGITCAEIARRMGVGKQRLYRWTTGRGTPRLDHLRELCRVLDVSADVLLGLKR